MNEIQVFNYGSRQVRTVEKDGEAWFVAKDVCGILGLTDVSMATRNLDDDEKGTSKICTPGGMQKMTTVSEFGCYRLMMRSNKTEAKKFQRWLAHEVLPEIRREGYYATPAIQAQIDGLKEEIEILQAQNAGLKKYIQDNSSFTMLGQAITPVKGTLSVGEAAKIFAQHGIQIGQNRLYKLLRDMGIIAKRKGRQRNQPTQRSIERGLCVIAVPLGSKGVPYLTIKCLQEVANVLTQEQFPIFALIATAGALHE